MSSVTPLDDSMDGLILTNDSGLGSVFVMRKDYAGCVASHNASWLPFLIVALDINSNCFNFINKMTGAFPMNSNDIFT